MTRGADAQIKQPGAHPNYSVELEPHLAIFWSDTNHWGHSSTGLGPGFRATIPFLDNGPIKTINNNMGIGFGLDWGHYSNHCWNRYYWNWDDPNSQSDCTTNEFWAPVVVQWNFFITKAFSAFGEAGVAIRHSRWSANNWWCDTPNGRQRCSWDNSETAFEPFVGGVGGRVHIGNSASFTFRLSWPYASVGASFFL
jgi:hypothetical protein